MTTHAISLAGTKHSFSFGHAVERLVRNWRARRNIARLAGYDDFILRDIGVTRDDVRWAASLPLVVNAAMALEDRAFRRRH